MPNSRRAATAALALPLLAAARPARLAAQGAVVGVAYDSLAGRPFAGATVQLVLQASPGATPRTTDADSAGRFRLTGVAPGRYLLAFDHPRLDSLGMDAPPRAVDVRPGAREVEADVGLPSARTIAAGVCGERRDSTGVLLGRVRQADGGGAPAAGAVEVRWAEVRADASGVHRAIQRVRAPVGAEGRYAACGVPTDVPVLVQAFAGAPNRPGGGAASGAVEVRFAAGAALLHRDLFVDAGLESLGGGASRPGAPRRGAARLAGRVRRPDGAPLAGARVVVLGAGAADSVAVTGADGTFRLDALPGGTYQVEALAVGLVPSRGAADLRPDRLSVVDFVLGERVPTLEPLTVRGAGVRAADEFEAHVRVPGTNGAFLTAEQVTRRAARFVSDALLTIPVLARSTAQITTNGSERRSLAGRGGCPALVYVDGARLGPEALDDVVLPSDVRGVEVYAEGVDAPGRYSTAGCTVVLVWTKSGAR